MTSKTADDPGTKHMTTTTTTQHTDPGGTLHITVKSEEEFLDSTQTAVETLASGESVDRPNELAFPSVEALFREFTPKKIELLGAVADAHPESITQAAEIVERDVKNVHQNLVELAQLDVIEFVDEGRAKRPIAHYDSLRIEVPFVDAPSEGGDAVLAD